MFEAFADYGSGPAIEISDLDQFGLLRRHQTSPAEGRGLVRLPTTLTPWNLRSVAVVADVRNETECLSYAFPITIA